MEKEAVAFFASIAAAFATAAWIFKPIVERTLESPRRRLQVADLFALVVLWQYALAFDFVMHRQDDGDQSHLLFAVLLAVVLTALWYGVAGTLSNRGVNSAVCRLICLCVGVPLGLASALLVVPVSLMLCEMIFEPDSPDNDFLRLYAAGILGVAIVTSRGILSRTSKPKLSQERGSASSRRSTDND